MSVLITICEFSWSRLDQGNQWLSSLDVYLFHYARGWIRPIINCSRVVYQKCKPPGWNFDDHPRESSVHSDKPRCTPLTQDVPHWPKLQPCDSILHSCDVTLHRDEIWTPAGAMRKGADENHLRNLQRKEMPVRLYLTSCLCMWT